MTPLPRGSGHIDLLPRRSPVHAPILLKRLLLPCLAALPFIACDVSAAPTVMRGADVSAAVSHDCLPSLRGVMPRPEELSRAQHEIPMRPVPTLDGPGQPADPVVQS